ncbi:MAG: pilus assembly protein PilP [Thermodesulfobacteriota bacterium]
MMHRVTIAVLLCGFLFPAIEAGAAAATASTAGVKTAPQKPPAPYVYQPAGKPDPFYSFIEAEMEIQKKREGDRKKKTAMQAAAKGQAISPLQRSEVAQFRLVGIAGNSERRTAMVEDGTAKKFYPLFLGTYIGPNEGRVVEILPDRVIVEERIGDPDPKAKAAQPRRITMMLRKGEQEGRP